MTKSPNSLQQLLRLLGDGEFHSGEQLGKILGLTRSAIWKLIKQCPKWDIKIESITGKGYRIPGGITHLDLKKILAEITPLHHSLLDQIEIFDTLPSTNDYLFKSLSQHRTKSRAVLAETQTAGKGRLGRHWFSPFAQNIYLSLLWHFPKDISELSGLSLAIAVAITKVLQRYGIENEICVKWPNDVLWQHKKLAGTLIELSCESNNSCSAVIGIGLNVNMSKQNPNTISQPWTDVNQIIGNKADRNKLVGLLLDEVMGTLILFQNEGISPFVENWNKLDMTKNKAVSIQTPLAIFKGEGQGINNQGHFLLKCAPNEIKPFSGGDVSLRLESTLR